MSEGADIDVAVIVPCLNAADHLPTQLDALARQRVDRPWEVVVVDNGSTDDTIAVALGFRDRIPRLRVESERARGRHHACNAGVRTTGARYVLFVDADDEVHPGYITAMAEGLDETPVVAARIDHDSVGSEEAGFGRVQTNALADGFGFLPFGGGGTLGVRRSAFLDVEGFDDVPYAEDADLCWRLQLAGHELRIVPKALIAVRQRGDLRAMFVQHRRFGEAQANLYRRYASCGMRRRPWRELVRDLQLGLVGVMPGRTRDEKARATRRLARCVGRAIGSVRHRVLYL